MLNKDEYRDITGDISYKEKPMGLFYSYRKVGIETEKVRIDLNKVIFADTLIDPEEKHEVNQDVTICIDLNTGFLHCQNDSTYEEVMDCIAAYLDRNPQIKDKWVYIDKLVGNGEELETDS